MGLGWAGVGLVRKLRLGLRLRARVRVRVRVRLRVRLRLRLRLSDASRITFHQRCGRLMTGHGSHTPAQIDCRHAGMVSCKGEGEGER